jgi:hypothetical protein
VNWLLGCFIARVKRNPRWLVEAIFFLPTTELLFPGSYTAPIATTLNHANSDHASTLVHLDLLCTYTNYHRALNLWRRQLGTGFIACFPCGYALRPCGLHLAQGYSRDVATRYAVQLWISPQMKQIYRYTVLQYTVRPAREEKKYRGRGWRFDCHALGHAVTWSVTPQEPRMPARLHCKILITLIHHSLPPVKPRNKPSALTNKQRKQKLLVRSYESVR